MAPGLEDGVWASEMTSNAASKGLRWASGLTQPVRFCYNDHEGWSFWGGGANCLVWRRGIYCGHFSWGRKGLESIIECQYHFSRISIPGDHSILILRGHSSLALSGVRYGVHGRQLTTPRLCGGSWLEFNLFTIE